MKKKVKNISIGINILGHDSSVSYFDKELDFLFSLDEERITRFKHDGTSIKLTMSQLIQILKLEKYNINLHISLCYENEDMFKSSNFIWKHNILIKEIRNLFNLKEIKEQSQILKQTSYNIIKKSFKFFPYNLSLIYYYLTYFLFFKNKKYSFNKILTSYLKKDLRKIKSIKSIKINFYDHHKCHNFSSYFFSPYENCLSISMDFYGDGYFSKVFEFNKNEYKELISSKAYRDNDNQIVSIGSIYTLITKFLGFTPNSDEGKVEALAAYGDKSNDLYIKLMDSTNINANDQIVIDNSIINYLTNNLKNFEKIIGKKNIASAVQGYLEDFVVKYIKHISIKFNYKNICLSGGTFANVKLNMKIYENCNINNIYIIPPISDNGAGLGALILNLKENNIIKYNQFKSKKFQMPYFGSQFHLDEILRDLKNFKDQINYEILDINNWHTKVAHHIYEGKIVGLFQGRIEFGPRALGNRSILGDASKKDTKDIINKIIKGRPEFQPFCPSILEEDRKKLFSISYQNKHMTCAFRMKDEFAKLLPSAIHIDNTARPQFVEKEDNENFYKILKEIKSKIGFGVVVNTSFNKHGRTMAYRPKDAVRDFLDSDMHSIFFENILVTKK